MKVFFGKREGDRLHDHRVYLEKDGGRALLRMWVPKGMVHYHSPDGHAWGYGGSGPTQLAHDMLCEVYGYPVPRDVYFKFRDTVIATLSQEREWVLTEAGVRALADPFMKEHAG